ncbi:hypothetical protein V6N12_048651 [Hibiscus sabdariffa]|uniref:Uncharacterized protein n=1 Tax=Hibiscus sabdariffa TaxID=183260 RepID=A0ABR2EK86_9ROSI
MVGADERSGKERRRRNREIEMERKGKTGMHVCLSRCLRSEGGHNYLLATAAAVDGGVEMSWREEKVVFNADKPTQQLLGMEK